MLLQRILAVIGVLVISGAAFATGSGFYMGLQVGQTNLNNLEYNVNTGQPQPPAAVCDPNDLTTCRVVLTEPSNTGIGERLFLGAAMNQYVAFEFGLAAYAPSEYKPDVDGYSHEPNTREYAVDLVGKVMYPFRSVTLFAKGGIAGVYKSSSAALLVPENESDGSVYGRPLVGVGVSYDLTPSWVLDVSASRIIKGDNFENADFYAVGISYHWVDLYCGQFLC